MLAPISLMRNAGTTIHCCKVNHLQKKKGLAVSARVILTRYDSFTLNTAAAQLLTGCSVHFFFLA